MRELFGFKLYKSDEGTFIQVVVLLLVLLIGYKFINSPETKQTIAIIVLILTGFTLTKILRR